MGLAEDVFERLRHITFEGEHVERMAALNVRMKLSPGVMKMLMRLSKDGRCLDGRVARAHRLDPSYVTALVDDFDDRGLARREPAPYDRRVKIIVLTDEGGAAAEIDASSLCLRPLSRRCRSRSCEHLRDLLDKILEQPDAGRRGQHGTPPPLAPQAEVGTL